MMGDTLELKKRTNLAYLVKGGEAGIYPGFCVNCKRWCRKSKKFDGRQRTCPMSPYRQYNAGGDGCHGYTVKIMQ